MIGAKPLFPRAALERSLPDQFRAIAARFPDQAAVQTGDKQVTYLELDSASDDLARLLVSRLPQPGTPVLLCLEDGVDGLIALMATLKAGAICVSLDPSWPTWRLNHISADSGAGAVLCSNTTQAISAGLPLAGAVLLNLDALEKVRPDAVPLPGLDADAIAMLQYTSGSTGAPKGVGCSHRVALHGTWLQTTALGTRPGDRQALFHSPLHAAGRANIFGPLLSGATLCGYDIRALGMLPLRRWLVEQEITILRTSVAILRQFLISLSAGETFPHVRAVGLGGDKLFAADIDRIRRRFPASRLYYHLATLEAGLVASMEITPATRLWQGFAPVGYPVEDKQVMVLDEEGCTVGPGEEGEIAVRSRFMATGYWQDAELTRRKIVADAPETDSRICLTGDLGLMRPDGSLVHLRRKALMLKVRGFRVEPAEIESALFQLGVAEEAVVVGAEDAIGETRLVAYLKVNSRPKPDVSNIRRKLAQMLPDYMLPAAYVFVERMPLTPNGKIDRKALPEAGGIRPDLEVEYAPPRDPLEARVAQIWAEALSLSQVGIFDRFLELGGNSLLATQIISTVRREFAVDLSMRVLLDTPTVADMSEVLAAQQSATLAVSDR